jgi:hypothetical protein
MKTIILAAGMAVTVAGTAFADFYVIEDQSSHKCSIVTIEPRVGTIHTVVGDTGYKTQQEAEAGMRTAKACSNTPIGSGSPTTNK